MVNWLRFGEIETAGFCTKPGLKMQADLVKDVMNETFDYIHQINVNGNETGRITDTKG